MGVPKFFRWLTERYPLTQEKLTESSSVEVDNLYLDMNGIIHNCTHANEARVDASEPEMIRKCFLYIERLVRIADPQKVLFMAIDGVAPRAKMNQQRARRYMTAKERQEAEAKALRMGEELPKEGLFDSNCITPGTPFMVRLHEHLKFFVRHKMATDARWRKLRVVYSGYDVPGEGEHKIMEFIRVQKLQAQESEPNVKHCLYGLDADLILLSLASHEPHFCLLREVVNYSAGGRGQPSREVLQMKTSAFQLLHIGILREYLDAEMRVPGTPFDLERAIDDFVLLCILVGNDFMPHSPVLDISEGAMDVIFDTYRKALPHMSGYLTCGEKIDHRRLEAYMRLLAEGEMDTLIERAKDQVAFEQRKGRGRGGGRGGERGDADDLAHDAAAAAHLAGDDPLDAELDPADRAQEVLHSATATMMSAAARDVLLSGDKEAGLKAYKERCYRKMNAETPEQVADVVTSYIQGLHWVMEYYYRGVPSWDWFYPYHYAPFLSDMDKLVDIECSFTLAKPVLPFHQLLMVLPPASHKHLPQALWPLVLEESSPIADLFPAEFYTDGEGKRADYEAVVLLPFVDKERLVAAFDAVPTDNFAPGELKRNDVGNILVFTHQADSTEKDFCKSTLVIYARDVAHPESRCSRKPPVPALPDGQPGFEPKVLEGCRHGKDAPKEGWPSLAVIDFSTELRDLGVNVLGVNSRKVTRALIVRGAEVPASKAPDVAKDFLGNICFVKYPHSVEAKVVGVTDCSADWRLSKLQSGTVVQRIPLAGTTKDIRTSAADEALSKLRSGQGIDIDESHVFLEVAVAGGRLIHPDGTISKHWDSDHTLVPLCLALREHPSGRGVAEPQEGADKESLAFKEGDMAIYLGLSDLGSPAKVMPKASAGLDAHGKPLASSGGLTIAVQPLPFKASQLSKAFASAIDRGRATAQSTWLPNYAVARKLGVDGSALGRMTTACKVAVGEAVADVGLSLRSGSDLCVLDMAQPSPEGKGWRYSPEAVALLTEYHQRFPWIAQLLLDSDTSMPSVAEAFPDHDDDECAAEVFAVQQWRAASALAGKKLASVDAQSLPADVVHKLSQMLMARTLKPPAVMTLENVKPAQLLPPLVQPGLRAAVAADAAALGDIVAVISGAGDKLPPFGSIAVVVGVHEGFAEVLCVRPFEGGSDLDGRVAAKRGAQVPMHSLLNITRPSPKLGWSSGGASKAAWGAGSKAAAATGGSSANAGIAVPGPSGARGFQVAGMGRGRGMMPQAVVAAPGAPPDPAQALAAMQRAAGAAGRRPVPPPVPPPMPPPMPPPQIAATTAQGGSALLGTGGSRSGGQAAEAERERLLQAVEMTLQLAGGDSALKPDQREALAALKRSGPLTTALLKRAENTLLLPLLDDIGRSGDNWQTLDAAAAAADAAVARARTALSSKNGGAASAAAERDLQAITELLEARCRAVRQAGGHTAQAGEALAALGSQLAAAVDTRGGVAEATLRLCESTLAPALERSSAFKLRAVASHTRAIIAEARVKALQSGGRAAKAKNGRKQGAARAESPLDAIFGGSTAAAAGSFVSGAASGQAADDAMLQGLLADMRGPAPPQPAAGARSSHAAAAAAAAASDAMLQGLMQKMHVDPAETRGRRSRSGAAPAVAGPAHAAGTSQPSSSAGAAAGAVGADALQQQMAHGLLATGSAAGRSARASGAVPLPAPPGGNDPLDSLLQPMQAAPAPSSHRLAPGSRDLSHWQAPPVQHPMPQQAGPVLAQVQQAARSRQSRPSGGQSQPDPLLAVLQQPMAAAAAPPPPSMHADPIASLLQPMQADVRSHGLFMQPPERQPPAAATQGLPTAPPVRIASHPVQPPLLAGTPPPPPPRAPFVDRQQPFVSLAPPPSPGPPAAAPAPPADQPPPSPPASAPAPPAAQPPPPPQGAPQPAAPPSAAPSAASQGEVRPAHTAAVLQGLLTHSKPAGAASAARTASPGSTLAALLEPRAPAYQPPAASPQKTRAPPPPPAEAPPQSGVHTASAAGLASPKPAPAAASEQSAQTGVHGGRATEGKQVARGAAASEAKEAADPGLALWDMLAKASRP